MLWQLCLPMRRSDKEAIREISRRYSTTYPALVSALLRGVLEKGLTEELLRDTELPMRYRRSSRSSRPSRPSAGEILQRVQNQVRESEPEPEPEPDVAYEAPIPSSQERQTTFGELCRMCELPGRNLDEECDGALETWMSTWGDLTDDEEQQLLAARDKRHAAYRQWRAEVAKLEDQIAAAELACERIQGFPRQRRRLKRKVQGLQHELRLFKLKVRWDQRDFDRLPVELK